MTGQAPVIRDDVEVERVWLDDRSWVDVARGWLDGAEQVYEAAAERAAWHQGRVFRYERHHDEPRLGSWWQLGRGAEPVHPVLLDAHRVLQHRYGVRFDGFALAWYRDERDSVAFHRDRDMQWLDDTIIVVLTLGARRPWLLRPRENRYAHEAPARGATHDLDPGPGDLLVMGGATQTAWEHSVPKVRHPVDGRISVQWRWTSRQGRQERGGSYSKPRRYSR
ncbi:MAG: alpha-ketoglutarate-dependent dioxygenase AlkB [Actinomycetota bacterium]|nr:alpha-ketoglutarate-dependent dioxygenase AlkB [Actinomycetota bacterium]